MFFFLISFSAIGFELEGRIDTRYSLGSGDGVLDQDGIQTHFITLKMSDGLFFDYSGSLKTDFDGLKNDVSEDGAETTDIAFRDLFNASNGDQFADYTVHTAALSYKREKLKLIVGRSTLTNYEYSTADALLVTALPVQGLAIECFAGKPWKPVSEDDFFSGWLNKEIITGGRVQFTPLNMPLSGSLDYTFLKEKTADNTAAGEELTYQYFTDHITEAKLRFQLPDRHIRGIVSNSFHGINPRDLHLLVSGYSSDYLFMYSLSGFIQFMDIEDFGERINLFSGFLSARHPYFRVNATASYDLSPLFASVSFIEASMVELGYSFRSVLDSAETSVFNPNYSNVRFGAYSAFPFGLYLNLFYDGVFASEDTNTINIVSGEFAKKWSSASLKIGSSYNVNVYEADYDTRVIEDRFSAQDYYIKLNWEPIEKLDLSFKSSYEMAHLLSLTDTDYINDDITLEDGAHIITSPRSYLSFDLRVSYSF
jgi:hypothetical protein